MLDTKVLVRKALDEIRPDEDLLVLTISGGILASLGIALGSEIVIIGSMLIAPFLDAIVAIVILGFVGKTRNLKKAFFSLFLITFIAWVTSLLTFFLIKIFDEIGSNPLHGVISWENVAISIVSGLVGMLIWTWPKSSNNSAGLSVAISLVPPLASSARSIVLGEFEEAGIFGLIYLVNIIGVILGSYIATIMKKNSPKRKIS